ncbi:hypothetical protein RB213_004620 [Colletotrichum asianum]
MLGPITLGGTALERWPSPPQPPSYRTTRPTLTNTKKVGNVSSSVKPFVRNQQILLARENPRRTCTT